MSVASQKKRDVCQMGDKGGKPVKDSPLSRRYSPHRPRPVERSSAARSTARDGGALTTSLERLGAPAT